jgi:hypothetical protein
VQCVPKSLPCANAPDCRIGSSSLKAWAQTTPTPQHAFSSRRSFHGQLPLWKHIKASSSFAPPHYRRHISALPRLITATPALQMHSCACASTSSSGSRMLASSIPVSLRHGHDDSTILVNASSDQCAHCGYRGTHAADCPFNPNKKY